MNDKFLIPADASHEQSEIIIGALYLSLLFAFRHIANAEGAASAAAFKEEFLTTLKSGGVSMSLLDDAATFDFVVAMFDGVGTIEPLQRSLDGSLRDRDYCIAR